MCTAWRIAIYVRNSFCQNMIHPSTIQAYHCFVQDSNVLEHLCCLSNQQDLVPVLCHTISLQVTFYHHVPCFRMTEPVLFTKAHLPVPFRLRLICALSKVTHYGVTYNYTLTCVTFNFLNDWHTQLVFDNILGCALVVDSPC